MLNISSYEYISILNYADGTRIVGLIKNNDTVNYQSRSLVFFQGITLTV